MKRHEFLKLLGLGAVATVVASKLPAQYIGGELNPPNLKEWNVAKGFPRTHKGWEESMSLQLKAQVRERCTKLHNEMLKT